LDGWKEILQQHVKSYVETIFKDPKSIDEAVKYILDKLEGNKTPKTAQSNHA
jgi:hypothetical protein